MFQLIRIQEGEARRIDAPTGADRENERGQNRPLGSRKGQVVRDLNSLSC